MTNNLTLTEKREKAKEYIGMEVKSTKYGTGTIESSRYSIDHDDYLVYIIFENNKAYFYLNLALDKGSLSFSLFNNETSWNYIVDGYKKNINEIEKVIQYQWQNYFSEIFKFKTINNEITMLKGNYPGFVISQNSSNLFIVKFQKYTSKIDENNVNQLKSKMTEFKLKLGLIICDNIYIYFYSNKEYYEKVIPFNEDDPNGIILNKLLKKENFSLDNFKEFIVKIEPTTITLEDILTLLKEYNNSPNPLISNKNYSFDNDLVTLLNVECSKIYNFSNNPDYIWDIIVHEKKEILKTYNFCALENNIDIELLDSLNGNKCIRINGMKRAPDKYVIKNLLTFIYTITSPYPITSAAKEITNKINAKLITDLLYNYFKTYYSDEDIKIAFKILNQPRHPNPTIITPQNTMTKYIAKQLFLNKGYIIDERAYSFSSKNNTISIYWSNPPLDYLKYNWTLILNDYLNKKLYLFQIPHDSISKYDLVSRGDKPELADLQIDYNDPLFTDTRSHFSFIKYLKDSIDY